MEKYAVTAENNVIPWDVFRNVSGFRECLGLNYTRKTIPTTTTMGTAIIPNGSPCLTNGSEPIA
jgi:hypothetical protein